MNRGVFVRALLFTWVFSSIAALRPAAILAQVDVVDVAANVQRNVVKLFGAGGFRRLEAYQTGVLISSDGDVLTAWSHLIDGDTITAVLWDGRRLAARLVGIDPRWEIAVLKVDSEEMPHFDLAAASEVRLADQVLAFANIYGAATGDEAVSVQRGVVSFVGPLSGRRGAASVRLHGDVVWFDAITSNPGAAGGAVTDLEGTLLALIGGEVRDERSQQWVNFGLPVAAIRESIQRIKLGDAPGAQAATDEPPVEPWTLELAGFRLVPNVVRRTPAYVESVAADSPAEQGGLRADDLIVDVDSVMTPSCLEVAAALARIDRIDPLRITVRRGSELKSIEIRR
jgi:serine protease Do